MRPIYPPRLKPKNEAPSTSNRNKIRQKLIERHGFTNAQVSQILKGKDREEMSNKLVTLGKTFKKRNK